MAQVSYGTITITDTNDIKSIIVEYNRNQSPSSAPSQTDLGWSTTRPAWAQGYYIWQRTRTHKSGTSTDDDVIGTAVCITGSTGSPGATGQSLTATKTQYTNVASNVTITTDNHTSYTWTDNVPAYNSSKPVYWARVTNTYINPAKTEYLVYKDQGLTDAVKTSYDANTTAQAASDKADDAWDKADNAETIAGNASSAISDLNQYFWRKKTASTNVPAGSYVTNIPGTTYESNPASGGFNSLVQATGIFLRNGITTLSSWTGDALTFYNPTTTRKAMELASSGLTFYDGSTSSGGNIQAQFGSSGAIQSGDYAISAATNKFSTYGTKIDLIHGEIYSPYFRLSQGSVSGGPVAGIYMSGTFESTGAIIGYQKVSNSDSNAYWKIGYMTDTNQDKLVYQRADGNGFIELAPNSTFIIQKNKIHTGWFGSNGYLTYPQLNSKYYDFGMNLPTSLTDKFLYIRYNAGTNLSEIYQNDDGWAYPFYVDADGKVHAQNFYIGNSTTPIGGGAGTVAEKLMSGAGSATQPVYFRSDSGHVGEVAAISYTIGQSVPSDSIWIKSVSTTGSGNAVTSVSFNSSTGAVTATKGTTFLTSYTETDPTVPAWAKAATKPSYELSEINGADDVKAIEALTGTSGFLKKTKANTWTLDTNTYLTSYTETDPVFVASAAHGITSTDISNWNSKTSNTGTVTSVTTSSPITGGTITGSGTIGHATSGVGNAVTTAGLYKFKYDTYGHVTGVTSVAKSDITGLGIPGSDTHYAAYLYATTSDGTSNVTTATSDPYLTLVENATVRSRVQLKAGTNVTSISAKDGVVTLNVKDTTYTAANAAPGKVASTSAQGSSTNYARQDHTHGIDLATGDANGQVKIAGTNVSVKGLGSWAYKSSGTASDVGLSNVKNALQITDIGSEDGLLVLTFGDGTTDTREVTITAYEQSTVQAADKATGDENGNRIYTNYASSLDWTTSTRTLILKSKSNAELSSVTIPDTTYSFADSYNASTNKGATVATVTNAINALDVTAITGSASKTITSISETNGKISATYSDISITKSQISDFPSSMAPTAHNHSQIVTVGDQRSIATTPNSYANALIFQGLKNKATIGNPSSDTYSYLVGLRGWSDSSGGNSHEIAFNDTGIFVRKGATTTWGSWERLYTTGNKPTASDVGLGNVENKSSTTIRSELTSSNVTTALGYTPYNSTNPNNYTSNTGTVTKVTAGSGLKIGSATSGGDITTTGTINHINSVTAKTAAAQSAKTLDWGGTFTIYEEKYDAQGHITGVASYNMTMPANPDTHHKAYLYDTTSTGTTRVTSNTTDPYLTLVENGEARSRVQLKAGTNITSITANNGVITFAAKDTTYTFSANNPTLAWNTESTIGTAGGTTYKVKMPANPNTDKNVTQAYGTSDNNYPLLFSNTAGIASTSSRGDTTSLLNNNFYVNPSKGTLYTTELVATKIKADDVNVTHLLTAEGIQTKNWTAVNIATIEGSFYITPTISATTAKFNYTSTGTIELTPVAPNVFTTNSLFINGDATSWTQNSLIMITGSVEINGEYVPIGTIKGTLSGITSATGGASKLTLSSPTTNTGGTPSILSLVTRGTQYNCKDIKISIYSYYNNSQENLLGIMMTTAGTKNRTYIDIYDGTHKTNAETDAQDSSTTYTKPVVRIGNLRGLPIMANGDAPTGWGIYTTNGYFEGVVSAKKGHIGSGAAAWNIGNDGDNRAYIYSKNNSATATTVEGMYVGTDGILNVSSASTSGRPYVQIRNGVITAQGANINGAITATSLKIGTDTKNYAEDIQTISSKASGDAEYSVEIITSNFNPGATSGNLVTLTAKVTKLGSTSDIGTVSYQWYGDNTSLGATARSATYSVPVSATYKTYTVVVS